MSGRCTPQLPAAVRLQVVLCPPCPDRSDGETDAGQDAVRACAGDIRALLCGQEAVPAAADVAVLVPGRAQAVLIREALADLGVAAAIAPVRSGRTDPPPAAEQPAASAAADLACLMVAMLRGGGPEAARRLLERPLLALTAGQACALSEQVQAMDRLCDDLGQACELWQQHGLHPAFRWFMQRSGAAARLQRTCGGRRRLAACLGLCEQLQSTHGAWDGPAGQYRILCSRIGAAAVPAVLILTPAAARGRHFAQVFVPWTAPAGRQARPHPQRLLLQSALECARSACCIHAGIQTAAAHPDPEIGGRSAAAALPADLAQCLAACPLRPAITIRSGLPPADAAPQKPAAEAGPAPEAVEAVAWEPPQAAVDAGDIWDEGPLSYSCRSLAQWLQHGCSPAAAADACPCTARHLPQPAPAAAGTPPQGHPGRSGFPVTQAAEVFLHRLMGQVHFPDCASADYLTAVAGAALEEHGARQAWLQPRGSRGEQLKMLTAWLHDIVHASLLHVPAAGECCLSGLGEGDFVTDMRFCLPVASLNHAALSSLGRSCTMALARRAGVPLHAAWLQRPRPALTAAALPRGCLRGTLDLVARLHCGRSPRYFVISYHAARLGADCADYSAPRMLEDLLGGDLPRELHLMFHALALFRHLCQRHRLQRGPARRALYEDLCGGVFQLYLRGLQAGCSGRGVLLTRPDFDTIQELDQLCRSGERQA